MDIKLNVTVESLGLNNEIFSQTWTRENNRTRIF